MSKRAKSRHGPGVHKLQQTLDSRAGVDAAFNWTCDEPVWATGVFYARGFIFPARRLFP
jgi:hypothetical protein